MPNVKSQGSNEILSSNEKEKPGRNKWVIIFYFGDFVIILNFEL